MNSLMMNSYRKSLPQEEKKEPTVFFRSYCESNQEK
jgi:hypothetical protein